jgi:hypothetical protein
LGGKLEAPRLAECWLSIVFLVFICSSLVWLPSISAVKKQKLDRVSTSIRFDFVAAVVFA